MKFCINCKHYIKFNFKHECHRNYCPEEIDRNPVTGTTIYANTEILDCDIERAKTSSSYCGPFGKFFVRKQ